MADPVRLTLPVGRFVSGSLTEKQTTDHQNRPKPPEKQNYYFGVAVRKDNPDFVPNFVNPLIQMVWNSDYSRTPNILQTAQAVMNQGFPGGNVGFSWKISDGDKPDPTTGQVNENTRGCYLVKFSSMYPIKCCDERNNEINPAQIKRGWFVEVALSAQINGNTDGTAGIYLNPQWVRFAAYGNEIVGGPSAEQAFGNSAPPAQLPPGASATPLGSNYAMPSAQQPVPGGFPAQQPVPGGFPDQPPVPGGFPAQQPAPGGFPAQQPAPGGFPAQQPAPGGFPAQQPAPGGTPGFPAAPGGAPTQLPATNGLPPTGYPSNPQTGMPVQPHNGFIPGR